MLAWIHVAAGRTEEAIQANAEAVQLAPWPVAMGVRAGLLCETGDMHGAEEMIERLRQMPAQSAPLGMLFYHLVRKELRAAAECYEKLIEFRHPQVTLSIYDPWMTPLRASPHWLRLARPLNLPGSAASHIQCDSAIHPLQRCGTSPARVLHDLVHTKRCVSPTREHT